MRSSLAYQVGQEKKTTEEAEPKPKLGPIPGRAVTSGNTYFTGNLCSVFFKGAGLAQLVVTQYVCTKLNHKSPLYAMYCTALTAGVGSIV